MSTLFDQDPRNFFYISNHSFECQIEDNIRLCEKYNITMDQLLKMNEIAEYHRRTNVMIADGNAKDEQFAGFGNLIKELISAISNIKK